MRNPNSFTDRHIRLLEAVRNKVQQINDPDPEIIFNELYEFYIRQTREFGRIPKIRFKPHSCQIKAELIRDAGLIDNTKDKELNNLRQKYGIAGARNKESRLFEAEWNNMMFKLKKATYTVALINHLFASSNQSVSEPLKLMQQIVLEEYSSQIQSKKKPIYSSDAIKPAETPKNERIKTYDEELADME